jgi:hypothetical protein|tara:strand:- start:2254 stop:3027 length:774 start_codon:yes stop_codon:yes gene_type:complete
MNKYSEIIKSLIKKFNFKIEHADSWYKRNEHYVAEQNEVESNFIKTIGNYSMSTPANHWAIIQSIKHIHENKIEGDVVECGVWKGGNLILFKKMMDYLNIQKKIYAYDTFDGMSLPTDDDSDLKNIKAENTYKKYESKDMKWCYSSLEEVKNNIKKYDKEFDKNFEFIKGKVEDTLINSDNLPDKISLLRLDTDFYESTKIELELLFPKLSIGGVLIIDDYGHWQGSKKAVDEYFQLDSNFLWFHRIDYASRLYIKT